MFRLFRNTQAEQNVAINLPLQQITILNISLSASYPAFVIHPPKK